MNTKISTNLEEVDNSIKNRNLAIINDDLELARLIYNNRQYSVKPMLKKVTLPNRDNATIKNVGFVIRKK
jgi:hypothetical protein